MRLVWRTGARDHEFQTLGRSGYSRLLYLRDDGTNRTRIRIEDFKFKFLSTLYCSFQLISILKTGKIFNKNKPARGIALWFSNSVRSIYYEYRIIKSRCIESQNKIALRGRREEAKEKGEFGEKRVKKVRISGHESNSKADTEACKQAVGLHLARTYRTYPFFAGLRDSGLGACAPLQHAPSDEPSARLSISTIQNRWCHEAEPASPPFHTEEGGGGNVALRPLVQRTRRTNTNRRVASTTQRESASRCVPVRACALPNNISTASSAR